MSESSVQDDTKTCCICLDRPRNVRLSCGHSCCSYCLNSLISSGHTTDPLCPMCMREIFIPHVKIWPSIVDQEVYVNPQSGSYSDNFSIIHSWSGEHATICRPLEGLSFVDIGTNIRHRSDNIIELDKIREDALIMRKMEVDGQHKYHQTQLAMLAACIQIERNEEQVIMSALRQKLHLRMASSVDINETMEGRGHNIDRQFFDTVRSDPTPMQGRSINPRS